MTLTSVPRAPSRCFTVASGKGGTGKSIITATLADLLAQCGFKVLLIDTDLFTSGLSFYLLGAKSRQARVGLQDVFIKGAKWEELAPTTTSHSGISIIPSVSRSRIDASELRVAPSLDFTSLVARLRLLRDRWIQQYDYLLFDSRGGTDHTSVAACIASGAYVIVTEADKTSWDLGDNLIESIEGATSLETTPAIALGFILNKNVLPSEAIEAFLYRRWSMPHLATIPIDEEAIRAFQNDEIPSEVSAYSRFVASVSLVVTRALVDEDWPPDARDKLVGLESRASAVQSISGRPGRPSFGDRRDFMLRLYGLLIVLATCAAAIYFKFLGTSISLRNNTEYWALLLVTLMYVFSVFMDRQFTNRVARILVRRLTRNIEPLN
jgi:cellulose biosynthesis protein BcsQ